MSHSPAEQQHPHRLPEGLQQQVALTGQGFATDPLPLLQGQQQQQQQAIPQQQAQAHQPQQQQGARMQSPFLAAQQLDSGTLESFAAHLLEALERSQLSQGIKQHQQRQQGGLPASCAAAAAAAGTGADAADACAAQYDADVDDSTAEGCSGSCTPTCSEDDDLDPDSAHAAVRALLESCLEEAAERAHSETAQSSGLYILGTDSSLCSSCSFDGPADTAATVTSSGAFAIDW